MKRLVVVCENNLENFVDRLNDLLDKGYEMHSTTYHPDYRYAQFMLKPLQRPLSYQEIVDVGIDARV